MSISIDEREQKEFRLKTIEFNIEQLQLKSNETSVLNTDCGMIKGVKRRTIYDDYYYSFERIPYAQPPVGELRFKAPRPVTPWPDVLDCTHFGPKPVQFSPMYSRVEGSENCLFLNVYTNNLHPTKPRAVMVWIYGGAFAFGEATREWFSPDYFMKKDVILVTLNYRLGALGFLSLCDPTLQIPGNAGLKDQILALRWIKRNCHIFGGNPDCITVFGESAGSCSTHLLMLSQQTRGLFHRAITQSGDASSEWAITHCAKRAFKLAQVAGYTGENNERDILNFLLACSAEEITAAANNVLTPEDHFNQEFLGFGPTLEPYATTEAVITRMPSEMMPTAWSNQIPFLLGATSNEGLIFLPNRKHFPEMVEYAMKDCVTFVPREVAPDSKSQDCLDKGLRIRRTHVAGEQSSAQEYYDIIAHKHFWRPIATTILARLKSTAAPTYLYRFDFDTEKLINPERILREGRGVPGVGHADDNTFLFNSVLGCRMATDSREYRTIERMIGLWTRFAETGNPNVGDGEINGMKGIEWQALQQDDATWKCLNINDALEFIELPEMEKIKFWLSLFSEKEERNKQEED